MAKVLGLWNKLALGLVAPLAGALLAGTVNAQAPTDAATGVPPAAAVDEAAQEASNAAQFLNIYRMGTGDKVRVIVFNEPDLSGEFTVNDGGVISLPLVGGITAQNRTLPELEGAIAARLREGYVREPRVNVQILNYRPFYITGEVARGGEYPYVIGLDVRKAVAMAGGYSYRANKRRVFITRAKTKTREEVPANQTTLIFPGDVVEIPERFF